MVINIPTSTDEWTFDLIKDMIDNQKIEDEIFDFKMDLPDTDRITELCCAFANTNGGFIIFGISDRDNIFTIEGLEYDKEFGRRFGDRLRAEPPIKYESPIFIGIPTNKKHIIIIRIPQSDNKPHVHHDRNKMKFWKRTNKGKDLMTLEEIRDSFQKTLKEENKVLNNLLESSIIAENKRRREHKDYYTRRIFSQYDLLLKTLDNLDIAIDKYITNKSERNEYSLKGSAKDFIDYLDVFSRVAEGDINEIKPLLNSPRLRDKFDNMIITSRNMIRGAILNGDDIKIYSLIDPQIRETIQVWMDSITEHVDLLREELQSRQ